MGMRDLNYREALGITDQAEADAFFEALVEDAMAKSEQTREEAESIQRQNLGYFAGYGSNETRARVERLFKTAHPIFGSIATAGPVSPEDAFKAGMDFAEKTP
jgi:hypothetical protein